MAVDTVGAEADKAGVVDGEVKVVGAEGDKAVVVVDEEVRGVADKDQKVAGPCNLQLSRCAMNG